MSPKAWRSISALFFLRVECNAGFLVGYFNLTAYLQERPERYFV